MQHKILTIAGYFQRHFELCKESKTQAEAYEKLEQELEDLQIKLGIPVQPRYSTFDSFRTMRSQWYKIHRD
jgi:hypothetical protein